ncbi:MAG: VOC family protein [Pseudomonadota bacterium]
MRIDHVNIRCSDMDATRDFLVRVMGLAVGHRPPFTSTGYWMTDETGRACAHLVPARVPLNTSGAVDHVAFYFDDLAEQVGRMEREGYPIALRAVADTGLLQGFIEGPDSLKYEIQGPATTV